MYTMPLATPSAARAPWPPLSPPHRYRSSRPLPRPPPRPRRSPLPPTLSLASSSSSSLSLLPGPLAALAPHASSASAALSSALASSSPGLVAGASLNSAVFLAGLRLLLRGLTPAGIAHAWLLGTSVLAAFGLGGYLLVCAYFLAGTFVTGLGRKRKEAAGIAEARGGHRGPGSVWGSGAAAALCAVGSLAGLGGAAAGPLWRLAAATSIVSKLADTASSEIGKAYGRQAYLSTTFQEVPRGTEGAVSLEGSTAGVVAAVAMATLAAALGQVTLRGRGVQGARERICARFVENRWTPGILSLSASQTFLPQAPTVRHVAACALAAVAANWGESLLGATFQGRVAWLTNDVVNVLQVSFAAAFSAILLQLLSL